MIQNLEITKGEKRMADGKRRYKSDRKDYKISVKLSEKDMDILKVALKRTGMTASAYIRELIRTGGNIDTSYPEDRASDTEFKGALTEQYVLQQLISEAGIVPYYYSAQNSRGKIDFLVQGKTSVIPIEVKAEENLRAKSLRAFCDKYNPDYAVRTSMSDYREQDWMTNIPLYNIDRITTFTSR